MNTTTSSNQEPITLEKIQEAMRQVEAIMENRTEIDDRIEKGAEMILDWAASPGKVLAWAGPELASEATTALMAEVERRYPEIYLSRVIVNPFCAPDAIASIGRSSVMDLGPWLPLSGTRRGQFKAFDVRTRT